MIPKRELDLADGIFNIVGYGAKITSFHVGRNVDFPRLALTLDHVRRRHNFHAGHIRQAHTFAAGCIDQKVLDIVQAVTRLGRTPHVHIVGLPTDEQVADFFSLYQEGRRPADITWLEPILLRLDQIYLNIYLWYINVGFLLQIHDPVDPFQGSQYIVGLAAQHFQLGAVDAHDDGIARARQHFADSLFQIGLHVADQPRVAINRLLNGGQSFVIVD